MDSESQTEEETNVQEKGLAEYIRRIGKVEIETNSLIDTAKSLNYCENDLSRAIIKAVHLKDLLKQSCLNNLRTESKLKNLKKDMELLIEWLNNAESITANEGLNVSMPEEDVTIIEMSDVDFKMNRHSRRSFFSNLPHWFKRKIRKGETSIRDEIDEQYFQSLKLNNFSNSSASGLNDDSDQCDGIENINNESVPSNVSTSSTNMYKTTSKQKSNWTKARRRNPSPQVLPKIHQVESETKNYHVIPGKSYSDAAKSHQTKKVQ